MQCACVWQLIDSRHGPSDYSAIQVNADQSSFAPRQHQLELVAGNLPARCVARPAELAGTVTPCTIHKGGRNNVQVVAHVPVNPRSCTHVPGSPLVMHTQPLTMY